MTSEMRRATRYALIATVVTLELNTGTRMTSQTADVSAVGCYVDTLNPLPVGSTVKLWITHNNETFATIGTVVYAKSNLGMGIEFAATDHLQLGILRKWISG